MKGGQPHEPVGPKRAVRGAVLQLEVLEYFYREGKPQTRFKVQGSGYIFSWFRALHRH